MKNLIRPTLRFGRHTMPSYRFFVFLGVILGTSYAAVLAGRLNLSIPLIFSLCAGGVLVAVAFGIGMKIVTGNESFTFYHHQIIVLASAATALWLLGRPILPYLDVLILTLGLVQALGRLGCFAAGCCHGRPHSWGIRYGDEHAADGFPRAYVGVRLFPVQAVESASLFLLAAGGTALALSDLPPGTAFTSFAAGYGTLRFHLEFTRGDAARPYKLGLSEAQWTSLAVLSAVAAGEAAGALPFQLWHALLFAGTALSALVAATLQRLRPERRLLQPGHVSEIADILDELARTEPAPTWPAPRTSEVRVGCTSLGLKLSGSGIDGLRAHYALSSRDGVLSEKAARTLAGLILRLRHPSKPNRLVAGNQGVFHLLIEVNP